MRRSSIALTMLFAGGCSGSGTVSLLLTDKPVDLAGVKAIGVTISKLEVHLADKGKTDSDAPNDSKIDDDGKWQAVFTQGKKLDLMQLRNDATAALGELDLPEGKITQIRMFLDDSAPANNQVVLTGGQICALDTSKVDKKGIKIAHPFKAIGVDSGMRTEIKLDFDASQSIDDESANGSCAYRLAPVINLKGDPVQAAKGKGNGK